MKNLGSLLALSTALFAADGCTGHAPATRNIPHCPEQLSLRNDTRVQVANIVPQCATQGAEDYLRAQIEALRPTTPRERRYDRRRILIIALAENEGVEEAVLQAELRDQHPCINGEANVGIVRTQIYGGNYVQGRYFPSSIRESLVFTGINNGQLEVVPHMTPHLPGTEHTCIPDRGLFFHRYECSHNPRRNHYGQVPLLDWTFRVKDLPGVAVCFSPSINEATICGFTALAAFANAYSHNTEMGICMEAHATFGDRPRILEIN